MLHRPLRKCKAQGEHNSGMDQRCSCFPTGLDRSSEWAERPGNPYGGILLKGHHFLAGEHPFAYPRGFQRDPRCRVDRDVFVVDDEALPLGISLRTPGRILEGKDLLLLPRLLPALRGHFAQ